MKRLHVVGAALAVLLILSVAWFSRGPVAAQENPAQPLQKWEYKLVKVAPASVLEMEATLNELGSQGSELCATVATPPVSESPVAFIFKRPKR